MAIQAALTFWREFSIQDFQRELDRQATEIAKKQDDSETSRKKLIELSRDFKKNSTEEVRRKVSPLLKSFQAEIDALSRRSQAAEAAFLSAYKRTIEIPDPIPVLEQAVAVQQRLQSAGDHEVQNSKLRETLEEYKSEFAQVKSQEVTINRLREKLKEMEQDQEGKMAARAIEQEAEILKTFQARERELKSSSAQALSRLTEAEAKVRTLQLALETTQSELLELKNKFDEDAHAKSSELDLLVVDLERAHQKAMMAEREVEHMRQTAGSLPTDTSREKAQSERVELELELQAREKENARLVEDGAKLQTTLSRLREASATQIHSLEQQLAEKTELLREVEAQLASQSDYDEIKRELDVIKMIEFSVKSSSSDSAEAPHPSKPLEVLLLEKNRALQNENTSLKLELSELRGHFSSLQTQHSDALHTLQEQKNLIGQLESDLLRAHPYIPQRTEGEGQATGSSSASIMSEVLRDVGGGGGRETVGSDGGADSLLPIVSSQRERFRQRNMELEAECRQHRSTVSVLQREADALRADNVKLYEKIKFLQSYPGTRKSVDDRDTLTRYSSQYETQLDPFTAFSAQERERKYRQLSGPDKATLVLGRFILSNKVARMVAFFYTLLLHLLVFLVLFKLAGMQSCERDMYAECAKRFTEHMQLFHPEHVDDVLKTFEEMKQLG
jgi:homeobox protein cut-like